MNYKKLLLISVLCTLFNSVYGSKAVCANDQRNMGEFAFFKDMPNEILEMILTSYTYHFSKVTTKNRLDLRLINTQFLSAPVVVDFFLRYCQEIRFSPEDRNKDFAVEKDEYISGSHKIVEHIIKSNSCPIFKCSGHPTNLYPLVDLGYWKTGEELPFKKDGKVYFSFFGGGAVTVPENRFEQMKSGAFLDNKQNKLLGMNPKKLIILSGLRNLPFELIDSIISRLKSEGFKDDDLANLENKKFQALKEILQWILQSPDIRHVKNDNRDTLVHYFISSILPELSKRGMLKKTKLLFPLFEKYCSLLREDRWSFFLKNAKRKTPYELLLFMISENSESRDITVLDAIKEIFSLFIQYPNWRQSDRIDTTCNLLNLLFQKTTDKFRILLFSLFDKAEEKGIIDLYQISQEKISNCAIENQCIKNGEYPLKLFLERLVKTPIIMGGAQTVLKEFLNNDRVNINYQDTNGDTVIHLLYQLYEEARTKGVKEKVKSILGFLNKQHIDRTLKNNKGVSVDEIFAKMGQDQVAEIEGIFQN
jgi:hypothetical protein